MEKLAATTPGTVGLHGAELCPKMLCSFNWSKGNDILFERLTQNFLVCLTIWFLSIAISDSPCLTEYTTSWEGQ